MNYKAKVAEDLVSVSYEISRAFYHRFRLESSSPTSACQVENSWSALLKDPENLITFRRKSFEIDGSRTLSFVSFMLL